MLRVLACSRPFVDGCIYADVDVWVGWIRRFGQRGGGILMGAWDLRRRHTETKRLSTWSLFLTLPRYRYLRSKSWTHCVLSAYPTIVRTAREVWLGPPTGSRSPICPATLVKFAGHCHTQVSEKERSL